MSKNYKRDWSQTLRGEERKSSLKTRERQLPRKAKLVGVTERDRRRSRRGAKECVEVEENVLPDVVVDKQADTGSCIAKSTSKKGDRVSRSPARPPAKKDRKRKRTRSDDSPDGNKRDDSKKNLTQGNTAEKNCETELNHTIGEFAQPVGTSTPKCKRAKKVKKVDKKGPERIKDLPSTSKGVSCIGEEPSIEMMSTKNCTVKSDDDTEGKVVSIDEENVTSNKSDEQYHEFVDDGKYYELNGYSVKFLKMLMFLKRALKTKRSNVESLAKMNDEAELLAEQNQENLKVRRDSDSSSDDGASQNSFGPPLPFSQYIYQQYESVIQSVKKNNQQMVRFIGEMTDEMSKNPLQVQSKLDTAYLSAASDNMLKNMQGDLKNDHLLNIIKSIGCVFLAITYLDQENTSQTEASIALCNSIKELRSKLFETNAARLDAIVAKFSRNPYFKLH